MLYWLTDKRVRSIKESGTDNRNKIAWSDIKKRKRKKKEVEKHLLTILTQNKSGVLSRIAGLVSRRGYNIDSLVVCDTENKNLSRMTMVVTADEAVICQIIKQLNKVIDVVTIEELDLEQAVSRELMLIKIKAKNTQRAELDAACNIYKAEIVDLSPESLVIELTGKPTKLDAFIELMAPYGIIELTRTGITALHRGKEKLM